MEQIIKNYGRFLLDAVVFIALFGLFFSQITDGEGNRGIRSIIGARIETEAINSAECTAFGTYQSESARQAPVIVVYANNNIRAGDVCLTDYIEASDDTGTELAVKVLGVWDAFGAELACSGNTVCFPDAGTYRVRVTAVDQSNRRTTSEIEIPVNK